jgi:hypothetical protein
MTYGERVIAPHPARRVHLRDFPTLSPSGRGFQQTPLSHLWRGAGGEG